MKAIVQKKYGSPKTLEVREIDRPNPKDNEVLVRIRSASLHIGDWHIMRGKPYVMRMAFGLSGPKQRPGGDIAGEVEAVGAKVTRFQPGDEVFGWGAGGFAEYACVEESHLAAKPSGFSFEQASALGVSAFTALHAVRDQAKLKPGHKVLINGASGGVGTFVVQIAKAYGAEVTGVCSTRNQDLVRSLGADHVIDYTQEDFTKSGEQYDFILDIAGSRKLSEYKRVLKPTGLLVPIGGPASLWFVFNRFLQSLFMKQVGSPFVSTPNPEDLLVLKELADAGKIKPWIDREFPLDETAQAYTYLGKGHAQGKVIIQMATPA